MNSNGREEEDVASSFPSMTSGLALSLDQIQVQTGTKGEAETCQGSTVKGSTVNDLPPEMLMDIFKFVDTRSLLNCRLVNYQWRETSNEILHQRPDAKITFHLDHNGFSQHRPNTKGQKTSLRNFFMCMRISKICPFARFVFVCDEFFLRLGYSRFFDDEDWTRFLSAVAGSKKQPWRKQNQRIKIKSLEFKLADLGQPVDVLIDNLSNLLLNIIPNLEEFGLDFSQVTILQDPEIKLFPETVENTVSVQLAHLKAIHFDQTMFFKFPGIVKDLFNSAVNLKKIYLYKNTYTFSTKFYDFLDPVGKFHLLKSLKLHVDDKFLLQVKECPDFASALFKLKLEELELDVDSKLNEVDRNYATNFLSNLFESSKNSLEKLTLSPLGFLNRLQFPRFKNLTDLKIIKPITTQEGLFFYPGVRPLDVFPAVRRLDLSKLVWRGAFPRVDSIPVFPRVQNLSVDDVGFTADSIQVLALLCPNLKHLKIHRFPSSSATGASWSWEPDINFLDIGRSIWTEMKQLESLEVDVNVNSSENSSLALDSCFTGISIENCTLLRKMMKIKELLEKLGSQAKIPESELTAEREHPSILDMTNLKALKINAYAGKQLLDRKDFFTKKLTWVSEELAFKFLPHLKPVQIE